MSEPEPALFAESGSSGRILWFGPVFAAVGIGIETLAPGAPEYWVWLGAGLLVFLYTLLLVRSRRRFLRVELTPKGLTQGSQVLPTSHIASLRDVDEDHHGLRVLGDNPAVPRRYGVVVLRLTDGARAVAWAHDGDGLRRALADLLAARRSTGPGP